MSSCPAQEEHRAGVTILTGRTWGGDGDAIEATSFGRAAPGQGSNAGSRSGVADVTAGNRGYARMGAEVYRAVAVAPADVAVRNENIRPVGEYAPAVSLRALAKQFAVDYE